MLIRIGSFLQQQKKDPMNIGKNDQRVVNVRPGVIQTDRLDGVDMQMRSLGHDVAEQLV